MLQRSRSRLRLLADYLAATRNEIAVDEMFLAMAHVQPESVGYLPRVPRWVDRATRSPTLTLMAWRLAWLVWLAGGALAFFALEYLKFSRQRRNVAGAQVPAADEGAVLGLSLRVCDIVHPAQFPAPGMPKVWLTMPWAPQHRLPPGAVERPMLTLVDRSDLRQAFLDAVAATYALRRRAGCSKWALQSYTAFRWFLARRAVDRVGGTLVTTEHFDRWAVLADRSVRAGRHGKARLHKRRLVLIQHGALGGLGSTATAHESLLRLPVRLGCVDELHAYSAAEEASFRSGVLLAARSGGLLSVGYFKPAIELSGELSSARLRILFVGHPVCEPFQVAAYQALRQAMALDAYYKPHPLAPMSAAMAGVGWTIVDNPRMFPRVDLLVSYPSTLVIEYEGKGIPASVHPINVANEELAAFLKRTRALIADTDTGCQPIKQSIKQPPGPNN